MGRMAPLKKIQHFFEGRSPGVVLLVLVLAGLVWETADGKSLSRLFVRTAEGFYLGHMPAPAETGISGLVKQTIAPSKRYRLMTIKHIPRIGNDDSMPHPYVGTCRQCHLYRGGPGPGSQPKTLVGAVLENLSKIQKLGPPLVPYSEMPHPPAGRCIKCHDIVVKVPRNKGRQAWVR